MAARRRHPERSDRPRTHRRDDGEGSEEERDAAGDEDARHAIGIEQGTTGRCARRNREVDRGNEQATGTFGFIRHGPRDPGRPGDRHRAEGEAPERNHGRIAGKTAAKGGKRQRKRPHHERHDRQR